MGDTVKVLGWGWEDRLAEGRSAGRCVCLSVCLSEPRSASGGVTSCPTLPNMWSSEHVQVNKRRDQSADKAAEFLPLLRAQRVFISADMLQRRAALLPRYVSVAVRLLL